MEYYRSWLVWHSLVNISVGHDPNIKILKATQMFNVARKTLSDATYMHCFHKARIVPWESKTESENEVNITKNWKHLCQKLNSKVKLDDYIHVNNEVTVTVDGTEDLAMVWQWKTKKKTMAIIKISPNMEWCLWCFIMTKKRRSCLHTGNHYLN